MLEIFLLDLVKFVNLTKINLIRFLKNREIMIFIKSAVSLDQICWNYFI